MWAYFSKNVQYIFFYCWNSWCVSWILFYTDDFFIFLFLFSTLSSELHSQGVSHWEFLFPFPQVKVLHNQLILFHNAIAAYFAGNQQQLEQTLKQFHIKLKLPGGETPSWLEEHWLSQHSWNMRTPKGNQIQKKNYHSFPFLLLSGH